MTQPSETLREIMAEEDHDVDCRIRRGSRLEAGESDHDCVCWYQQAGDVAVRVEAMQRSHASLVEALRAVTENMDRVGGDDCGMPECPWCRVQGEQEHAGYCALEQARAALKAAEEGRNRE